MQGQKTFNVDKATLLGILRENRAAHIKEHKEALEGYRTAVIEELRDKLSQAESGKT